MLGRLISLMFFSILFSSVYGASSTDPLPSWNEGKNKQRIMQFVQDATNPASKNYIDPVNRIAVFDNDGTLWVEQPIYTEVAFALDRIKNLAPQHPEWMQIPAVKAVLNNQYQSLSLHDIGKLIGLAYNGMTIDQFQDLEKQWLATTKNTHFDRYFTDLIYQPMLEVIRYLQYNHFNVYIVSGGSQDFIRAYAEKSYGIPPANVIGSAGKLKFVYRDGHPDLVKTPQVFFIDDKTGKPKAINLFIGKKPVIAFGNSDGDQQMLEWTQSNGNNHLMFLVHHDDARREYAYDAQSKVGTLSNYLMQEAKENNWQIISMRNDWKEIFPSLAPPPAQDVVRPVKAITPAKVSINRFTNLPIAEKPTKQKMNAAKKNKSSIHMSKQKDDDYYIINY